MGRTSKSIKKINSIKIVDKHIMLLYNYICLKRKAEVSTSHPIAKVMGICQVNSNIR